MKNTHKQQSTTGKTSQENLTNTTGYGILRAIVKYYPVDDHIKQRAEYYLDPSNPIDEKLWWKRTEGSFFSHVLMGDLEGSMRRGCKYLTQAIADGLINKEI